MWDLAATVLTAYSDVGLQLGDTLFQILNVHLMAWIYVNTAR
jgi:hypothetical protein